MLTYLKIGALVALVALGFWFKHVLNQNAVLREQNEVMQLQIEKTNENLKLVVQQLDRETEYRQIAESALNNLSNEVPDVVYSQRLPPEIQRVIDDFQARIGQ